MTASRFQVHAIRYAHRDGVSPHEVFCRPDAADESRAMAYYIWLITAEDGAAYLFDTGFGHKVAEQRGRTGVLRGDPTQALTALGAPAERIRHVFLSHLHFDHAGELDRFPAATFWIQRRETAFWTGPHASRPSFRHVVMPEDITAVVRLNLEGRVRFTEGDEAIAPGLSLHLIGGHTAGLQALRIETAAGSVVLASDATHYYDNLETDRPYSAHDSLSGVHAGFDRLRELAGPDGVIVPGHDPLVMERFPGVPGLEDQVVEISAGHIAPGHTGGAVTSAATTHRAKEVTP
ncbi:N-acyl homoserine lactonase family protein [Streptomyces sp. NPDC005803]|uniref:N-acyl homoserine lactonase family protein n=1 Tax=Streptomyces sp. NPDC005803 TaxID=3154297 RepID=UPI0033D58870